MAFVTINIGPDEDGAREYWVEIKRGDVVLALWKVPSQAQGEQQILEAMRKLGEQHDADW